jgi:hypothetical protein
VGEKTRNDNRMKMLKSISMKQWAAQLKKLEEEMGYENRMVVRMLLCLGGECSLVVSLWCSLLFPDQLHLVDFASPLLMVYQAAL